MKTDLRYKLAHNIRARTRQAFKSKMLDRQLELLIYWDFLKLF